MKFEKIILYVILSSLLSFFILATATYFKLPDIIPIHFNAAGKADNYGDKLSIFLFPSISFVCFVFLESILFLLNKKKIIPSGNLNYLKSIFRASEIFFILTFFIEFKNSIELWKGAKTIFDGHNTTNTTYAFIVFLFLMLVFILVDNKYLDKSKHSLE